MAWELGDVPYLNTDPLTAALLEPDAERLVGEPTSVLARVPALLLEELLGGRLDAALVSVGGILPHPGLQILPGMGIVSRGNVRSIQLFCRKEIQDVRTVALDASSRSGVALGRVLFAERWRRPIEFVTMPPDLPAMLEVADAGLLIGNPALAAYHRVASGEWEHLDARSYDLGAEWTAMTGLPFVYAAWAIATARPAFATPDGAARLGRVLQRARDWGTARLDILAERGASDLNLPLDLVRDYLRHSIHYELGTEEQAGMELFCRLAVRHGVLPDSASVRLASPPTECLAR